VAGGCRCRPGSARSAASVPACLILYGAGRNVAIGAAVVYGAIGLIVPFVGGLLSYLLLKRQLRILQTDAGQPKGA
jgi:uncharacterized membrane protein YbhN (UPF0104 family)